MLPLKHPIYIHTHTYIIKHTHMYIYIYIHTHIYIYTLHICTCIWQGIVFGGPFPASPGVCLQPLWNLGAHHGAERSAAVLHPGDWGSWGTWEEMGKDREIQEKLEGDGDR